ncbi:MAG: FliH/SctL family protein [bacterium]
MDDSERNTVRGKVLAKSAVVLRRDELEAHEGAARILGSARREARELLAQARSEAERLASRARAEGLAEGRQQAVTLTVAARAEAARMRQEAGARLIRLAVELARKVLEQELRASPDALGALARQTLAEVHWYPRVTLRLHPEDARTLRDVHPGLADALDDGAELILEEDEQLPRGSCQAETESGLVDGSVDVQLAALERALLADAAPGGHDG